MSDHAEQRVEGLVVEGRYGVVEDERGLVGRNHEPLNRAAKIDATGMLA